MSDNPSRVLAVATIGTPYLSPLPACDPAIDVAHPEVSARLTAYNRSRSVADRDALPLRDGARLTLFDLSPLTPAALGWIDLADATVRYQRAFCCSCFAYTDADGHKHQARVERAPQGPRYSVASQEWLDEIFDAFGQYVIDELGEVAIVRAKAGPRAVDPFGLPRGLTLRP